MSKEAHSSPEARLTGVEALDQLTELFEAGAVLLEQGGIRPYFQGGAKEFQWNPEIYLAESDYPPYPRIPGSDKYEKVMRDHDTKGYFDRASMRVDDSDGRFKSARFSFVMPPRQDGYEHVADDRIVWKMQMPRERHHNGQRRMIIEIYKSPASLLGVKLAELHERHTTTNDEGRKVLDADNFNADLKGEYSALHRDLYSNHNNLGVPVVTENHRRYILGRNSILGAEVQQELVNLAGIFTMSVDAGIAWQQALRNDPEEFHSAA